MSNPIGEETLPDGETPASGKASKKTGGAARIAKQHLPVKQPTAAEITAGFKLRHQLTAEETLTPIRKQFAAVDIALKERDAAKARVAKLEIEVAELKKDLAAKEAAAQPAA